MTDTKHTPGKLSVGPANPPDSDGFTSYPIYSTENFYEVGVISPSRNASVNHDVTKEIVHRYNTHTGLLDALEAFSNGSIDVSGTAVIIGANAREALTAARKALATARA